MSAASAVPAARTPATTAASSPIAPALPFRRDDEPVFPVGGALLLFGLLAAALWIVWWDRRRGSAKRNGAGAGWASLFEGRAISTTTAQEVKLLSTTRLDGTTRIHVLAWQGRQLLVAVQSGQQPVVLDRLENTTSPGLSGVAS